MHWNAGLWDVIRILGDEPLTPLCAYENFIGRIDKRLRTIFPNAKIVFATSTAIYEAGYTGTFKRLNKDIEQYNQAALSVLAKTDTHIDDLYEITKDIDDSCRSDMTHFNTENGAKTVGGAVVRYLCSILGIEESELSASKAEEAKIDADIMGV